MIPSNPMLIIPTLSEKIPPRAAKAIGVAILMVAAKRPTLITSRRLTI
jgi:hypothetical protein